MKRRQTHGAWAFGGVELGVAAALAVAVAVLMVAFFTGSDGLVSDIARVVGSFQAHPPQSEADSITMIEDGPSVCCEGFYTGGRVALAVVLLGGIPLAVVGFVLARRTDLTDSNPWTTRWKTLVQSCLVFQLMNFALSGFLAAIAFYTFTSVGPFDMGMSGLLVFLVANVAMSALAVRAWRTVQRSVRASEDFGIGR